MNFRAILVDKKVVPLDSNDEWSAWFNTADRTVKKTELEDGTVISTVFLGVNHGFGLGDAWFETMVFDALESDYNTVRYATWEEAEIGHDEIAASLEAKCRTN